MCIRFLFLIEKLYMCIYICTSFYKQREKKGTPQTGNMDYLEWLDLRDTGEKLTFSLYMSFSSVLFISST